MFRRDADPIEHRPVYKRVSINDPVPAESHAGPSTWEICEGLMKQHEANRIWEAVKEASGGSG